MRIPTPISVPNKRIPRPLEVLFGRGNAKSVCLYATQSGFQAQSVYSDLSPSASPFWLNRTTYQQSVWHPSGEFTTKERMDRNKPLTDSIHRVCDRLLTGKGEV